MAWKSCMMVVAVLAAPTGSLDICGTAAAQSETAMARDILDATGVTGGLIVQIGCGDGKLLAALGARGGYLVQGLDTDSNDVETAHTYIKSLDLYGKINNG